MQVQNPGSSQKSYANRFAWSSLRSLKKAPIRKIWSPQDPRPPPRVDEVTKNFNGYQSAKNNWGTKTPRRVLQKRVPSKHKMDTRNQAADLQTCSLQWMNETTRFTEALRVFVNRTRWSPSISNTEILKGWGTQKIPSTVPRLRKMQNPAAKGGTLQQGHSWLDVYPMFEIDKPP
ncbi:hypothetical protein Bca52824_022562 [Brassica carinata]|uniref:Uncharacterized protein n=1 Tax=Brassica carinata TaxID=52824 RepID=A0A8X8ARX3_BRACI|nr:hypothetical protein Bca52824_022562 [Brassica carinata]